MNFSTLALLLLAHPLVRVYARLAGSDAQLRRNLQETSCLAAAVTNGEINASHEVEEFDCNVDALLEKIEGLMEGVAGCANKSATDELSILVGTDDDAKNLCTASEDRWHEENDNPFISIFNEGKMHDKEFYDGNTKYNTMRQTDLELGSGAFASNVLEDDAGRLARILENRKNGAEKAGITWPDYTSQFESCELRAAMCCWSQDRQANDDNGNCGTPYDDECLDADPSDNTDICYVDMERAPLSNHVRDGFAIYGGDEQDGEGAAHCHGFAWPSDPSDTRSRYIGNNLFFVSMYDHLYQRGYVREIPGAPMCACIEQMAVVTRADCTQLDVDETWEFNIDTSGKLDAHIIKVDIDFNACQGANNNNNDLSAYYEQLRDDGDATEEEFEEFKGTVVGKENCPEAIKSFLQSEGLQKAPAAVVKTDQYVYAEDAVVSIRLTTKREVEGEMEIGILSSEYSLEDDDANDLTFEDSYEGVDDEDVLSLPGSDGWDNGEALGEGSWRAVLLTWNDDGDAIILSKSEVFTVLGPGDRPPPTPAPPSSDSYWVICGRNGGCARGKDPEENSPANIGESHEIRCCADERIRGFNQKSVSSCPEVFGSSRGCKSGTYTMAVEHCEELGGRLCTSDELERDCTKNSGCGFDADLIWSSTPSEDDNGETKIQLTPTTVAAVLPTDVGRVSAVPGTCIPTGSLCSETSACCSGMCMGNGHCS